MWEVSTESKPKARKDYMCGASGYVMDAVGEYNFTIDEIRQIKSAEKSGWKILKGEVHIHIRGLYDGMWQTFRGKTDMCDLCSKYGLWPDE